MRGPTAARGFTYLAVIFIVLLLGLTASMASALWSTLSQRDKERELVFAGRQFQAAIERYAQRSVPTSSRYPLKHLKKWLYWPWGEYRVLRDASAVLFTAQEEARLATQSFAIYRARAEVVGFGLERDASAGAVDAELFHTAFPATRGRRVLLFMSRLHPKKGCDLLIEAFAGAAASDASLHLAMAGPDQVGWQADLQALAQRLQVTDRITWCGMLTGELKWAALRAAEAFVLPSHQENFGVAVAEALAEGVPVLISDKVNIWREIVAADAGLVGPDTLEGTRSTLRRWLEQSPEQRRAMRAYASDCFERHFRMSGTAHRLAEVVALRGRAATRGPCAIHSLET